MSSNPYEAQPPKAFWRSAVSDVSPLQLTELYTPKFDYDPQMRIASAGSCFAQHIGAQFKQRGFRFRDMEPPPPMVDGAKRAVRRSPCRDRRP